MPKKRRYDPGERESPPTYDELFEALGFLLELAGYETERFPGELINPEANEFWCALLELVRGFRGSQVGKDGPRRIERGDFAQFGLHLDLVEWFDGLRHEPEAHDRAAEVSELRDILAENGLEHPEDRILEALAVLRKNDDDQAPLESFRMLLKEQKSPAKCANLIIAAVTPTGVKAMERLTRHLSSIRKHRKSDELAEEDPAERLRARFMLFTSAATLRLQGAAAALSSEELQDLADKQFYKDIGLTAEDEQLRDTTEQVVTLNRSWFYLAR